MLQIPTLQCKRLFSTSRKASLFKALGSTLKNASPKQFQCKEILKPVGVATPPDPSDGIDNRSFSEKKSDWLNNDNRLARKENLEKEFATSGMYDMFIFRKTGGKVFYAPKSYFKKDKALYFPNLIADQSLSGTKKVATTSVFTNFGIHNKFTVVRVHSSAVGQTFTRKFFQNEEGNYLDSNENYNKLLQKYPSLQVANFAMYDNFVKKWLFKAFTARTIKKTFSNPEYFNNFLLFKDTVLDIPTKEKISYLNGITGYIYLVDSDAKIRWLSSGDPTDSEVDSMWKVVQGLQNEMK